MNDHIIEERKRMTPLRKIHIAEARAVAERIGADAVVVLAFKGDEIAGASYGATKKICKLTGEWMDELIDNLSPVGVRLSSQTIPRPPISGRTISDEAITIAIREALK